MAKEREVPYDKDAEESVLGSCMLSKAAVETAVARLRSDDFFVPGHQRMFEAIVELFSTGEPVDPTTVTATLDEIVAGGSKAIGGRSAVMRIQASTPASANIEGYADVVIERADRRRLIAAAQEVLLRSYDLGVELDEVVAAGATMMETVGQSSGSRIHDCYEAWASAVNMTERWVVPGLLEHRDRVILVAAEGIGKSFLLRQWAVMVAAGIHWFSERPMRPGRTLIIDVENSDRQIVRNTTHMYQMAEKHGIGFDPSRFVIVPLSKFDITARADRLLVENYLAGHRPDLLVIGPLYKILPPPGGKLSYEEAALQGVRILDDWRARYDCAILMEHHAPKGSGGRRDLDPFGSSVLLRWPEYGLTLEQDKDNPTLTKLGHFRGQREKRAWPEHLVRGTGAEWPWRVPTTDGGEEPF